VKLDSRAAAVAGLLLTVVGLSPEGAAGQLIDPSTVAVALPHLPPTFDGPPPLVPSDPDWLDLWGLHQTAASYAWRFHTGSAATTVAVIDTGIDYTHPDLYLNVWIHQGEIPGPIAWLLVDVDGDGLISFRDLNDPANQGPGKIADWNANGRIDGGDLLYETSCPPDFKLGDEEDLECVPFRSWQNGLDDDGNGYVDDLIGWDFKGGDNDPMDRNGHGTHVAGTIGAAGDDAIGVVGVNWQVSIMPVRISIDWEVEAKALRYAVRNGARISNHSYGHWFNAHLWEAANDLLEDLGIVESKDHLRNALLEAKAAGHVVITSAGNGDAVPGSLDPSAADEVGDDNDEVSHYPSNFDLHNVVSVTATDDLDQRPGWANYGRHTVDLGAPGVGILSTVPGGAYEYMQGTSMAAPHVAGAAALVWDYNPGWSYRQVIAQVLETGDRVPDLAGSTVTGRRLEVRKAVAPGARIRRVDALLGSGPYPGTELPHSCEGRSLRGVRVTFQEDIQPATFGLADLPEWSAPLTSIVPTGVQAVGASCTAGAAGLGCREFDVFFGPVSIVPGSPVGSGTYHLAIGPEIRDLDGDRMDVDRDGADGEPLDDRHHVSVDVPATSYAECVDFSDVLEDLAVTEMAPLTQSALPSVQVTQPVVTAPVATVTLKPAVSPTPLVRLR
jgi:subtilisin family serine protease